MTSARRTPTPPRDSRAGRERRSPARPLVAGVAISNPDRPIGDTALTKLDLVRYVERVAPWLLPHLVSRPLSLVRCPGSDIAHCFYQRHPLDAGAVPEPAAPAATDVPFVRLPDLAAVVRAVQLGAFEFHSWGSSLARVDRPDRLVLDLDPDPALPWRSFREACELTRALLDRLELAWFVKTTGGKGLHFVVPIARRDGWEPVRAAARAMALELAAASPSLIVATMGKARRQGRVYVDWLRNGEGATAVAAYSPRARPGLPVSMPIAWEDLARDVRGTHFGVANVPGILARRRDPWARYATTRQSLTAAHRRALRL
jgi:bifunctional non-homologous end joining protein LigD